VKTSLRNTIEGWGTGVGEWQQWLGCVMGIFQRRLIRVPNQFRYFFFQIVTDPVCDPVHGYLKRVRNIGGSLLQNVGIHDWVVMVRAEECESNLHIFAVDRPRVTA
jgi:hypothetical protein